MNEIQLAYHNNDLETLKRDLFYGKANLNDYFMFLLFLLEKQKLDNFEKDFLVILLSKKKYFKLLDDEKQSVVLNLLENKIDCVTTLKCI